MEKEEIIISTGSCLIVAIVELIEKEKNEIKIVI